MKLIYAEAAISDLVRLREFIAVHDPAAAARVASELVTRIEHLCRFPGMGRMVMQAPQPEIIRDAIFGSYTIRYSIQSAAVIVLRVWHHREERV